MFATIVLYLSLLTGGLSFFPGNAFPGNAFPGNAFPGIAAPAAPPQELCRLRGSVFVTDDPQRAHYYVFVVDYESAADLNVYAEENKLFADQPGLWFYTDVEAFADFNVYFTDNRGMADFTIYYTDVASFAGCRR